MMTLGFSLKNICSILLVLILGWKHGILVGGGTGITIGVNSFGSQTAVYYRVYNADTGRLLYKADNQADYLWNVEGLNQVVLKLPTCRMYKVKCSVISFPENTSGRVMVWTY